MVVQVPTGGVLKCIVMSPSTGDCRIVALLVKELGHGYCPTTYAQRKRVFIRTEKKRAVCSGYLQLVFSEAHIGR